MWRSHDGGKLETARLQMGRSDEGLVSKSVGDGYSLRFCTVHSSRRELEGARLFALEGFLFARRSNPSEKVAVPEVCCEGALLLSQQHRT